MITLWRIFCRWMDIRSSLIHLQERRMEENLGNPWRLGREKTKTGEEEEMRREEATRSNAQMERRWNELTSSSRWNDAGRQKDEKEPAGRQFDDFKIPKFSILVNLQAGDPPGTWCWSCMCENETSRRWRRRGRWRLATSSAASEH